MFPCIWLLFGFRLFLLSLLSSSAFASLWFASCCCSEPCRQSLCPCPDRTCTSPALRISSLVRTLYLTVGIPLRHRTYPFFGLSLSNGIFPSGTFPPSLFRKFFLTLFGPFQTLPSPSSLFLFSGPLLWPSSLALRPSSLQSTFRLTFSLTAFFRAPTLAWQSTRPPRCQYRRLGSDSRLYMLRSIQFFGGSV